MIPKYQDVGVIAVPNTGFFALAAAKHRFGMLVHDCVVHIRERQVSKHPQTHRIPNAPISSLELVELNQPETIGGTETQWAISHWNETRTGEKISLFEGFYMFLQFAEADAREQYAESHKLWKRHGYFCLEQYDAQVREVAKKKFVRMHAKQVINGNMAPKPMLPNTPMGLTQAQLRVLKPILPNTVDAILNRDRIRAVAAFEFESHYQGSRDRDEEIDYCIVRAYTREGDLPTDEEIAREIAGYGLPRLTSDAIKKRRLKLELFGRNPGPKARKQ